MMIEKAKGILSHGDSTTYPSIPAARHIRSVMRDLVAVLDWQPANTAPVDGSHIMVCSGPYSESWGFNQAPPCVVHYFDDGFYLSRGIVQGSYNDQPVEFSAWRKLGDPP